MGQQNSTTDARPRSGSVASGPGATMPTRAQAEAAGDYLQANSACGGVDTSWFVADKDDYVDSYNKAIAVCSTCPTKAQDSCLIYAQFLGIDTGVWGGVALGRNITPARARARIAEGWTNNHGHLLRSSFLNRAVVALARDRFMANHDGEEPTRSAADRHEMRENVRDIRESLESGQLPSELRAGAGVDAGSADEAEELDLAALMSSVG